MPPSGLVEGPRHPQEANHVRLRHRRSRNVFCPGRGQQYGPTSPAWPWLFDRVPGHGTHLVPAHGERLRIIAESNYKTDELPPLPSLL